MQATARCILTFVSRAANIDPAERFLRHICTVELSTFELDAFSPKRAELRIQRKVFYGNGIGLGNADLIDQDDRYRQ